MNTKLTPKLLQAQRDTSLISKSRDTSLLASLLASVVLFNFPANTNAGIIYNSVETFDDPIAVSNTQSEGVWYPDRFPSEAFDSFDLNGSQVLRIGIDPGDGAQNRPVQFVEEGGFYNTQGRRYDLPANTQQVTAMIYFPGSWEGATTRRRSDLWAIAQNSSDELAFIPIIGIANNDGNPVIRYYNSSTGLWTNTSVNPVPGTWYRFDILLRGTEFIYVVNNVEVGRVNANAASYLLSAMLQAYNYNDSRLDPELQSADAYDAYWDNFSFDFVFTGAYQPDLVVGSKFVSITEGENIYSGEGILFSERNLKPGQKSRTFIKLENDGGLQDSIRLNAAESSRNVTDLRIDDLSLGGNVTAAIRVGSYVAAMSPGEAYYLQVRIGLTKAKKKRTRNRNSKTRYQLRIGAASLNDPAFVDAVRIKTTFKDKGKRKR